tara:strand:+ start:288 stop:521 length:234 start_codon:yes stop_codon:yes gene_type:complete
MKPIILFIPFIALIWGCSNAVKQVTISETQRQREVCLNWYGYRIDTANAITELDLQITTESELMAYCDFFRNVADTN